MGKLDTMVDVGAECGDKEVRMIIKLGVARDGC